jgi:hypothetical protein
MLSWWPLAAIPYLSARFSLAGSWSGAGMGSMAGGESRCTTLQLDRATVGAVMSPISSSLQTTNHHCFSGVLVADLIWSLLGILASRDANNFNGACAKAPQGFGH